jgi:hypothetical protein
VCASMSDSTTADISPALFLRTLPDIDDDEEGDVCRICRMVGEADNPLYFPCKCSGSIRYVHEQCLKEWLNHSGNTHCEVSVATADAVWVGFPPLVPIHHLVDRATGVQVQVLLHASVRRERTFDVAISRARAWPVQTGHPGSANSI